MLTVDLGLLMYIKVADHFNTQSHIEEDLGRDSIIQLVTIFSQGQLSSKPRLFDAKQ